MSIIEVPSLQPSTLASRSLQGLNDSSKTLNPLS